MNRTVKILTVLLVAAFSYTMPSHACWWNYIDDMYSFDEDSGNDDCGFNNFGNDDLSWDDNDGGDDLMYGEITDWGSSMEGFVDELIVDGSSNDSFWGSGIFIEQDLGMDDGGSYFDTNCPQQTADVSADNNSGVNNEPTFSEYSNLSNTVNVGGPPCKKSDWKTLTVQQMKFQPFVHYVPNLPNQFLPQKLKFECVANSIAIVSSIVDGTNPIETRDVIRKIAREAGYDLKNIGIPNGEIHNLLYDYCAILDDNKFNRNVIENYLDNEHKPIMAVTDMLDDETGKPIGAHMLVIVAHDYHNYYCAYGGENAAVIPKTDFEVKNSDGSMKYKIYMYNGKKHVNR